MIVYNSKLAKVLTFISGFKTIMLFSGVFTEKDSLTEKEIKHEDTHCKQYADCFALGMAIAIFATFIMFAFEICSWKMLWLLTIPISLFYVWYGIEYLVKLAKYKNNDEAYMNVGFEKQAYRIAATWDKPCDKQEHYYSFGWINE